MDKKEISKIGQNTFRLAQQEVLPRAMAIRNDFHRSLLTVAHLIRWGDGEVAEETRIICPTVDKDIADYDNAVREKLREEAAEMNANAVILVKEGVVHIVSKNIIGDVPIAICWFETANGETHTWSSFMPDGKIGKWDCNSKFMSKCPYRGIVDKNYVEPAITGTG